jgi:hypothetical protein
MKLTSLAITIVVAICLACGGTNSGPALDDTPALEDPPAVDTTPDWLTAARQTEATADDNPCDSQNPTYAALVQLNTGMAEAPSLARDAFEDDPAFEAIRSTDTGRRWIYAQDADVASDRGIVEMLTEHPGWSEVYAVIPRNLSFSEPNAVTVTQYMGGVTSQTGTWTVQDGTVRIELPTESWVLTPQRGAFYMVLDSADDTWAMDPVVCL